MTKTIGTEATTGGFEGEGIGDFEAGRKVARIENCLHGGGGHRELGENGGAEHRAAGGLGDQAKGGLGDDA